MIDPFSEVLASQESDRREDRRGIWSVCSANPYVLETALLQSKEEGACCLVEATSNQVDQFGGYTGMKPLQFRKFLEELAQKVGLNPEQIILGGDHLGPNRWQDQPAAVAMEHSRTLIEEYVKAGFRKIHLDTSMRCADDPGNENETLPPKQVAERAADLCSVAEKAFSQAGPPPIYVIGTEVPPPGGAKEELRNLEVSRVEDTRQTIELTRQAFEHRGLESVWPRVIAVVVQPGVEFGDAEVIAYDPQKARELAELIESYPGFIYEAHSTDYQQRERLRQLVEDHFGILKVGPELTFAFREAVFALAMMETELFSHRREGYECSQLRETLDEEMVRQPAHWKRHYHGSEAEVAYARKYSFSDRSRYYWPNARVSQALERLIENLSREPIPLTLISQFMPRQYRAIRGGLLSPDPVSLIRYQIRQVTYKYSLACRGHGV